MTKQFVFLLFPFLLCSCSFGNESVDRSYLNYKYVLKDAGDIHEYAPNYGEVLNRDPGFTSYTSLFDKNKSYINFQCYGNNVNNFYCETTFSLVDKNGNIVFGGDDFKFKTRFSGGQSGTLVIEDPNIALTIGTIYVYTPYWCRYQLEYDVDGSGIKKLLTFEFWKNKYNPLPEWSI